MSIAPIEEDPGFPGTDGPDGTAFAPGATKRLLRAVAERLGSNEFRRFRCAVCLPDESGVHPLRSAGADCEIEVQSLGFSQTAGAGALKPLFFFSVTVRSPLGLRDPASRDVDTLAECIVSALHRSRVAGMTVLFSKAVRGFGKQTVALSSRSLPLEAGKGEIAEALFFWASPLSLEELEEDESVAAPSGGGHTTSLGGGESPIVVKVFAGSDGIWD